MGEYLSAVTPTQYEPASKKLWVPVPDDVILGISQISVTRPTPWPVIYVSGKVKQDTFGAHSNSVLIPTAGRLAFAGLVTGKVAAFDSTLGTLHKMIDVGGMARQTVTTADLSRVYVLVHPGGVAVVDALTLSQVDADSFTPEMDTIRLPGERRWFPSPSVRRMTLTVASGQKTVYIIDIRPNSDFFHQVVGFVNLDGYAPGPMLGDMVVSTDGKRLYVAAPGTTLYGGTKPWFSGGREAGKIVVVNVDPNDESAGVANWSLPIAALKSRRGAVRNRHNH